MSSFYLFFFPNQMSALIEFNRIIIFFSLFRCLIDVYEGNQVCSWEREVPFNSLFKQLWYSLILHQNSISGSFLNIRCSVESETISMKFYTRLYKNPLVYLCMILKYLALVIWKTLADLGRSKC